MSFSFKPVERLRNHLTYGNLWLYILSLMKEKKRLYAYNMDAEIEKDFGFRPNRIMIYMVLYKLEGEGLISSKHEERRKYYFLTKKGRLCLEEGKKFLLSLGRRL